MAHENERKLRYMEYVQREEGIRHHTENEDSYQYELLKAGDMRAVEEAKRIFASDLPGHVSDDPVRNCKYLFVASATLASRAAISVGMDSERAYNISDLYIQRMDLLPDVESVRALHTEMIGYYTSQVALLDQKQVYSRSVARAMDYIYEHLHQPIRLIAIAEYVHLSPSYLSTLFRREAGVSISNYILNKRMEAARNMLRFSDIPYSEISATLAFSSQSHFIQVFRKQVGCTPREFRERYSEE
ncbi:MAG: helix-turn-helix domain-containing protein [Clostridia bacterium]|nr:helix-turn-helix domain-containing protein [Clostridia bacterium]